MIKEIVFGHDVMWDNEVKAWRYCDNGDLLTDGVATRLCPKCKKPKTAAGDDPCIAALPGVSGACCGHGRSPGHIVFDDGRLIRGTFEPDPRYPDLWRKEPC